jgi:hypothetical protein
MQIDKILSGIRQSQETTKEASVVTSTSTAGSEARAPRDALVSALNAALETPSIKTASEASSPVTDIMKVAEEMAGIEQEAQVKQAEVLGAAFADSFVARLGAWQEKAAQLNAQSGQPVQYQEYAQAAGYGKFAAENPGLMGQAQNIGYTETKAALEKQANDAYVEGFNDTVDAIHKTASEEFLKGAAIMSNVLDAVMS